MSQREFEKTGYMHLREGRSILRIPFLEFGNENIEKTPPFENLAPSIGTCLIIQTPRSASILLKS